MGPNSSHHLNEFKDVVNVNRFGPDNDALNVYVSLLLLIEVIPLSFTSFSIKSGDFPNWGLLVDGDFDVAEDFQLIDAYSSSSSSSTFGAFECTKKMLLSSLNEWKW